MLETIVTIQITQLQLCYLSLLLVLGNMFALLGGAYIIWHIYDYVYVTLKRKK